MNFPRLATVCLLVWFLGACQTAHFPENDAYPAGSRETGYRYEKLAAYTTGNSEELFVILSFSGGGTRAAALAFGVLEKLRNTDIVVAGERRSLLQEVDVISSNSGGSYTAAYYGLFREGMFDDGADSDLYFTRRFLERDIESDILARVFLSPVNWVRLVSPTYNRSDLTAEFFDEEIFDGKRFGDLTAQGRPFIILNAHDTTKGTRFEFTQDHFDLICSDLTEFPVARAVMASSALHGLFGAVRLRNFDKANCAEPDWVALALGDRTGDRGDLDANRERYELARKARAYRDKDRDSDPAARYYVHLADGGAVDNLGLRAPLWALRSNDPSWSVQRKLNRRQIKTILVISVNAASDPDSVADRDASGPGPLSLVSSAVNGAIDTVTLDSIQATDSKIRERIRSLESLGWLVKHYGPILIDFEHIDDSDLRHCFKNVGTRLALGRDTIKGLRQIGYRLVGEAAAFQGFLADLDGVEKPVPETLRGEPLCTLDQ